MDSEDADLLLETSIRDAFVGRKHLVSFFFYLEKAYEIYLETWYFIRLIQNRPPWFFTNFYLIVIFKFVSGTYRGL